MPELLLGVVITSAMFTLSGAECKLHLVDTAGQEKFGDLRHAYYRTADAVLLFVDVAEKRSREGVYRWIKTIGVALDTRRHWDFGLVGSGCTQRVVRSLVMNAMFSNSSSMTGRLWLYPWLYPIPFHGVKLGVAMSECLPCSARENRQEMPESSVFTSKEDARCLDVSRGGE